LVVQFYSSPGSAIARAKALSELCDLTEPFYKAAIVLKRTLAKK
jgi:hypothetical protein